VSRIAQLVKLMDAQRSHVVLEVVRLNHAPVAETARQLGEVLEARKSSDAEPGVSVQPDARTNQLVLVGARAAVQQAVQLARWLDTPQTTTTKVYTLQRYSAERLNELLSETIGDLSSQGFRSAVDVQGNRLVVVATAAVHGQIEALANELDAPLAESRRALRVYPLENVTALELLETFRGLEESGGQSDGEAWSPEWTPGPWDRTRPEWQYLGWPTPVPGNWSRVQGN
jgi:type II secretory pathway component GspD/PulD (secretin)